MSYYYNPYSGDTVQNQRFTGGSTANGTSGSQTPQSRQNATSQQASNPYSGYGNLAQSWRDTYRRYMRPPVTAQPPTQPYQPSVRLGQDRPPAQQPLQPSGRSRSVGSAGTIQNTIGQDDYYLQKANEYNQYDTPWKGTIGREDVVAYHRWAQEAAAKGHTNVHITQWLQAGRPQTYGDGFEIPNPGGGVTAPTDGADKPLDIYDPSTFGPYRSYGDSSSEAMSMKYWKGQLAKGAITPERFAEIQRSVGGEAIPQLTGETGGGAAGGAGAQGGVTGVGGVAGIPAVNADGAGGAPVYQEFDPNSLQMPDIASDLQKMYGQRFDTERQDLDRYMRHNAALTGAIDNGGFGSTYGREMGRLIGQQGAELGDKAFQARESAMDRLLQANQFKNSFELDKWAKANEQALQKYGIDRNELVARYSADQGLKGAKYGADAASSAANASAAASRYNADLDYQLGTQRLSYDDIFNKRAYDLGVFGINRDVYGMDQNDRYKWAQLQWLMSPEARMGGGIPLPDTFPWGG